MGVEVVGDKTVEQWGDPQLHSCVEKGRNKMHIYLTKGENSEPISYVVAVNMHTALDIFKAKYLDMPISIKKISGRCDVLCKVEVNKSIGDKTVEQMTNEVLKPLAELPVSVALKVLEAAKERLTEPRESTVQELMGIK